MIGFPVFRLLWQLIFHFFGLRVGLGGGGSKYKCSGSREDRQQGWVGLALCQNIGRSVLTYVNKNGPNVYSPGWVPARVLGPSRKNVRDTRPGGGRWMEPDPDVT